MVYKGEKYKYLYDVIVQVVSKTETIQEELKKLDKFKNLYYLFFNIMKRLFATMVHIMY